MNATELHIRPLGLTIASIFRKLRESKIKHHAAHTSCPRETQSLFSLEPHLYHPHIFTDCIASAQGARLLITTASPGAARVCFSVAKPEGESRQLKPVPGTQPPCISSLHAACPFSQLSQGLRNNYPMPINQQVPCLSTGR